jgi:uncharacterized protein YgiM (DUF1202 family)
MAKLKDFIALLEQEVKNHSIYVWGAQGQRYPTVNEAWIRKLETSTTNANRAVAYWEKQCAAGYEKKLGAFDCSGLGVWALMSLGIIKSDMNANGLKGKCTKIAKAQLVKGCFVFRVNSVGRATHIGYVVDDSLNVIEAMGRDVGVVKRSLNASGTSYWNHFGIPTWFADEIVDKPASEIEAIASVTIREKPDKASKALGTLTKGKKLERKDNGWYKVIYKDKEAYVSARDDLTKQVGKDV